MTSPPVRTPAGLEPAFELADYYPILLYAVVVVGLAAVTLLASHMPFLKPRRPGAVKQMPYESGMDPVGSARMQFDVRFYLIAITFLIFDVELLILYPWAVAAYQEGGDQAWRLTFGPVVFWSVLVFIGLLAIAYIYEWRKGTFKWR